MRVKSFGIVVFGYEFGYGESDLGDSGWFLVFDVGVEDEEDEDEIVELVI